MKAAATDKQAKNVFKFLEFSHLLKFHNLRVNFSERTFCILPAYFLARIKCPLPKYKNWIFATNCEVCAIFVQSFTFCRFFFVIICRSLKNLMKINQRNGSVIDFHKPKRKKLSNEVRNRTSSFEIKLTTTIFIEIYFEC
jgi:hypothetical protein